MSEEGKAMVRRVVEWLNTDDEAETVETRRRGGFRFGAQGQGKGPGLARPDPSIQAVLR